MKSFKTPNHPAAGIKIFDSYLLSTTEKKIFLNKFCF